MHEKILLIDGNSIINRAFYALPVMSNKDGEITNAVYGFLNIFFKILDEEKPEYAVVAFDLPKPTFRHEKFSDYKGTRKSMPDDLRPQIPLLKNLLSKMNIKVMALEGFEADDVLGTLANKARDLSLECVIMSGDRDLLQIAGETVKIRIPKTRNGQTVSEDYFMSDVFEKIGVTPKEYIDVKALMGDPSDNIPGVPGIGEKTAVKIIQEYKSIEAAIEAAAESTDGLKPAKAFKNLVLYREQAILSKELATIIIDAPIELNLEEAKTDAIYCESAYAEIKRLEFKTLIPRFSKGLTHKPAAEDKKLFRFIESEKDVSDLMHQLCTKDIVAFSAVFVNSSCLGLSFSSEDVSGAFIKYGSYLNETSVIDIIRPFMQSNIKKLCLDSKKDMVYLSKFGIRPANIVFDASLAAYVINPLKASYSYDTISMDFLNEAYPTIEALLGKGRKKISIAEIDPTEYLNFACLHSHVAYRVYPQMIIKLEEQSQLELYYNIELPLAEVLKDMELCGIRVNRDELIRFGEMLNQHIKTLAQQIYDIAGVEFNLNSPQQISEVLFVKLGLKGGKRTTQGYSTSADELEKLWDKHEIIPKILEYKPYVKLKSTYVDGLLPLIDEQTGKIYSTFNQMVTATGRISSTEPNLQNIPIRMDLGRQLRKVFVPTDDSYIFLDADYSQIELRLLAHMSGDTTLIDAFIKGQDIHSLTASQVFKIAPDEVTAQQRSNAKAVNFGIVYGISSFSLSQDLGITKKEADRYITGYFEKYPGVKNYLEKAVNQAKAQGYASTIFNRRRPMPELGSANFVQRSFGERVAMNMPVQGSAADVIKIAMIRVNKRLKNEGMHSRLILQVHDELLLEVKRDELEQAKRVLKEEMENAVSLSVKMEVDLHEGESWYDAK